MEARLLSDLLRLHSLLESPLNRLCIRQRKRGKKRKSRVRPATATVTSEPVEQELGVSTTKKLKIIYTESLTYR